jgi:lantibiotic modifying enzyme
VVASLTDQAAEVSLAVAERLENAAQGGALTHHGPAHSTLMGCGLLAARISADRPASADAAMSHLQIMIKELPAGTGNMVSGTMGVVTAAVVTYNMTHDPRLRNIIASGTTWLSGRVHGIAERYSARKISDEPSLPVADYDTITGLAGLGRVLLLASRDGHPGAESGLERALEVLTELLTDYGGGIPGWRSSHDDISSYVSPFVLSGPSGGVLTGMAHGVAGPLALLAVALDAGRYVDGQRDAVRAGADWLLASRDPGDLTWPLLVSRDHRRTSSVSKRHPLYRRWCTGASGIARALHLAGVALDDRILVNVGVDALVAIKDAPEARWDVAEPILCCGSAGILESMIITSRTSPDPRLDEATDAAVSAVLGGWRPDTPFGFQRPLLGVGDRAHSTVASNGIDLLYGASGAALALYDYAFGATSSWPSVLLLQ